MKSLCSALIALKVLALLMFLAPAVAADNLEPQATAVAPQQMASEPVAMINFGQLPDWMIGTTVSSICPSVPCQSNHDCCEACPLTGFGICGPGGFCIYGL